MTADPLKRDQIAGAVRQALSSIAAVDMHTHLYPPAFGTPVAHPGGAADATGLMLWGIDELVTYHYLVAEVFRVVPAAKLPYETFWAMPRAQQADHIWKHLFVERTPLSEACRGVVTTLRRLGLDPNEKSLDSYRAFFARQDPDRYIDRVMELAQVQSITMTNDVFDDNERRRWLDGVRSSADPRFRAVLRIDPLLLDVPGSLHKLSDWGFAIEGDLLSGTVQECRRFLRVWIDRMQAIYLAVSLPPEFRYPARPGDTAAEDAQEMLEEVILPVCAERGLCFAMMIGARRGVNPALRGAGDMGGEADVASVANLCAAAPQNKFFVTMLARENQHELAVATRKFGNLMLFGCWWFLNNPSLIEEITRMRFELLGTSFIPQHSDARILEQLVYKWDHSRHVLGKVLAEKYIDVADAGREITASDIERDLRLLLADNFSEFLKR